MPASLFTFLPSSGLQVLLGGELVQLALALPHSLVDGLVGHPGGPVVPPGLRGERSALREVGAARLVGAEGGLKSPGKRRGKVRSICIQRKIFLTGCGYFIR